ncbi:site-specific DNA-methyltransferase [Tenacibaculum finnmarkense]|uniref:site-specific DNA-methyltransferase n=1 Tax=Tenacibaculum finnmarkense TaxID=2781243 RepID=UPI001EFB4E06|nr:site-specific DNA-methyltransferase [Tenacibaculum finnmarkense]MCG8893555.1 site-specific DNA-methyltransferase [Tenacibaculum finnmarkense]
MSIHKIQQGDNLTKSKNLVADNIDKLKELFPEIVTEGKIDFKVLQDVLGENIEEEDEYYRFTWAGKAQARREAHKPSTGTLRPVKEDSVDWDTTENVYIEGDNLEVLKLLQKSYAGKVKMIYIDPPYNTGNDFVYKDNYKDNLKNYQEVTGQVDSEGNKLSTNSDSDGRYHSNWLNMMYPRLRLARNLLKDDGVIFMSLDDNEVDNLKKIGNEVFGENNFITSICHKARASVSNDKIISQNHNHILVFSKNSKVIFSNRLMFGLPPNLDGFDKVDDKGNFKLSPVDGPGGAKKGNPFYEFKGIKGYWRYSKEKMQKLYNEGEIVVTKGNLQRKFYLKDAKNKRKTDTSWWDEKLYTSTSTTRLKKIMGGKLFDNPKPIELMERMIELSSRNDNDIILDFFGGSSSTAHAVLNSNIRHNNNKKFILVQLPECTNEKSEAFKAGYKTIAEIGKERIRRAGKKIAEENPEKAKDLDLGFKVFKLDSSNIKSWGGNPDNLQEELFDAVSNIKIDRTEEDVLYEILLKYGLDLTLPIEEKIIEGKTVFNVGFGALFICLGDNLTNKVAEGIGKWKEELQPEICRIIFKDTGFTDVEKTNSIQTLKRFGITEIKSI